MSLDVFAQNISEVKLRQREPWQTELANAVTSIEELVDLGFVSEQDALSIPTNYSIRIPHYILGLIDKNNPRCPIGLQALPSRLEKSVNFSESIKKLSQECFGTDTPFIPDSIGDIVKLAAPRLTHRYENRAILHFSSLCALNCRFCFRKTHLNEKSDELYEGDFNEAIKYIHAHPEIKELILTGGDPLSVTDSAIARSLQKLNGSHLKHIRIHTKMPATLPSRMTLSLAETLVDFREISGINVSIVAHFNHPKELTSVALEKLKLFMRLGIQIYNQSVLLRGVNDELEVLRELFETLYFVGVRPFYLHHTDLTPGTFHFRTSIARGRALMQALSGLLSGPAIPQYVLDLPSGLGKVNLMDTSRVIKISDHDTSEFSASLYEINALPKTRAQATQNTKYADISKR